MSEISALVPIGAIDDSVRIATDSVELEGRLSVPASAKGIVLFADGGSGRESPRADWVVNGLREAGLAALLFDLLTGPEPRDPAQIFDLKLLADRLRAATRFVRQDPRTRHLPVGYFASRTGAAAALIAAATDWTVAAVVSCGGRPDLVACALPEVKAPTLLIVGGNDRVINGLNQQAYERLGCERQLTAIPGASHLIDEPGGLAQVATLANQWFARHLTKR